MSSRAGSPGAAKKRPAARPAVKHERANSLTSEAAARLLQSASETSSQRGGGNRSVSGRTKASTINNAQSLEDDADSSDIDEADFGMETFVDYHETTAEKTRMKILLDSFNQDQMARYEVFRRVKLNTVNVKKLANNVLGQSLPQNIALVIAGSAKVFVSEIVEAARQVQRNRGDTGSLTPEHLREAYRQYKMSTDLVPHKKRKLFR